MKRKRVRTGQAEWALKLWGMCQIERAWRGTTPEQRYAGRVEEALYGVADTAREQIGFVALQGILEGFEDGPASGQGLREDVMFVYLTVDNALRLPSQMFDYALPKENDMPVFGPDGSVLKTGWMYLALATHVYVHEGSVSHFSHEQLPNRWATDRAFARMLKHVTRAFTSSVHDENERSISEEWAALMGERLRRFDINDLTAALGAMPSQSPTYSDEPEPKGKRKVVRPIRRKVEGKIEPIEIPWLETAC